MFIRLSPPPFVAHNRVEVLVDGGPFFQKYLEAIHAAQRYIFIETYIIKNDRIGWQIAEALVARAKANVEVALNYDGYGSYSLAKDFVDFLRNGGVKLVCFRPVSIPRRVWPWSKRNHRKILIVDGRIGLVGGLNIADEYTPVGHGGAGWRDTAALIEGPAVAQLEALFRRLWRRQHGAELHSTYRSAANDPEGHELRFIGNFAHRDRAYIRQAYLWAFIHAQRSIRISNAYFIPDHGLVRALVRAARRGVEVEVIVAGNTDVQTALYATRSLYSRLLKAGVRIYEWLGPVLHAKTAVVDSHWTTIGSSNLDSLSLFKNLEVNVGIRGERVGAVMDAQFHADKKQCREIHLDQWQNRPCWPRVVEGFFGLFRQAY